MGTVRECQTKQEEFYVESRGYKSTYNMLAGNVEI